MYYRPREPSPAFLNSHPAMLPTYWNRWAQTLRFQPGKKLEVHRVLNRLRNRCGSWLSLGSKHDSQRSGPINLSRSRAVASISLVANCATGRASVDWTCPTCSLLVAPIVLNWLGQWGLFCWHWVCITNLTE